MHHTSYLPCVNMPLFNHSNCTVFMCVLWFCSLCGVSVDHWHTRTRTCGCVKKHVIWTLRARAYNRAVPRGTTRIQQQMAEGGQLQRVNVLYNVLLAQPQRSTRRWNQTTWREFWTSLSRRRITPTCWGSSYCRHTGWRRFTANTRIRKIACCTFFLPSRSKSSPDRRGVSF